MVNNGSGFAVGSIYDKLGIPTQVDDITINALPLRAYNLIINTWFIDENLQNSLLLQDLNLIDHLQQKIPLTSTI